MLKLEFENRVKAMSGRGASAIKNVAATSLARAEKVLASMPKFKSRVHGTVILTLTGDTQIMALNREYRGIDKPTDVLSFSYFGGERFPGDDSADDTVGEIIISVATAKKQAREHGKTLNEEMQFLFIHGVLHVFGFDHIKTAERKIMFDLQDKIIGNKSWRAIADQEAA